MNMNLKKLATSLIIFVMAGFVFAGEAWADAYEEEPVIGLSVDKKIASESAKIKDEYKDNYDVADYHFVAEDKIYFKIRVYNSSDEDLIDVQVEDRFPDFVDYVSGLGSWDADNKMLKWEINRLNQGETKEYIVEARVVKREALPWDVGTRCDYDGPIENWVRAYKGDKSSEDTARFCIEKGVLEEKLPEAGPADTGLILAGSLIAGLVGWAKLREDK